MFEVVRGDLWWFAVCEKRRLYLGRCSSEELGWKGVICMLILSTITYYFLITLYIILSSISTNLNLTSFTLPKTNIRKVGIAGSDRTRHAMDPRGRITLLHSVLCPAELHSDPVVGVLRIGLEVGYTELGSVVDPSYHVVHVRQIR